MESGCELRQQVATTTPETTVDVTILRDGKEHGVLISNVEPGSLAAFANLQAGDLIVEANRQPVATVDELSAALAKSKESVLLLVKRASLYVTMKAG